MSGKSYVTWVNLNETTDYISQLMSFNYGRLVVSIDFFDDREGETRVAATGSVTFEAQTTESEDQLASINQGTVDVSLLDYDRPFAEGPVLKLQADLSSVTTAANYARVSAWRGE
jgi:hypothetical protein